MQMELRDVPADLWLWRVEHPAWRPGLDWEPLVASACVESAGETVVLDPLAPPADASEVWKRLDVRPPTVVVVLKPDHVRDVDLFVRRYGPRVRPEPLRLRMSRAGTEPDASSVDFFDCGADASTQLPAVRRFPVNCRKRPPTDPGAAAGAGT